MLATVLQCYAQFSEEGLFVGDDDDGYDIDDDDV